MTSRLAEFSNVDCWSWQEAKKLDDLKIVRFGIWHFLHGVKKSRAAIHFLNLHQDPFCRMDGSAILFESRSSVTVADRTRSE